MTPSSRPLRAAHLYLYHCDTMRDVAAVMGVSVWTVHRDLTVVLPEVDGQLAELVRQKIEAQLEDRSRRGGLATRGVARWRGWGKKGRVMG